MLTYITKRLKYLVYLTPVASLFLLVYTWNTTNPVSIGPLGMLFVFILLYIFWVSVFFILLHLIHLLLKRLKAVSFLQKRRREGPFHWRLAYYIASIVAFIPVLLLAMQSVNQLSLRDILLVFIFVGLAIFYVVKRA